MLVVLMVRVGRWMLVARLDIAFQPQISVACLSEKRARWAILRVIRPG